MKNYIGMSTSPHEASLAIVNNQGDILYAEATERPLQSKRAWGSVPDHINFIDKLTECYCDPDLATVAAMTWTKKHPWRYRIFEPYLNYKTWTTKSDERKRYQMGKYMTSAHQTVMRNATTGLQVFGTLKKPLEKRYYDHHLTHAAMAAFGSQFEEAVCVVMDGFGEAGSVAAFHYRNGWLEPVKNVKAAKASLGFFYAQMCQIAGFDFMRGEEWKLMGLAAFGTLDTKWYELIRPLIYVDGVTMRSGKLPKSHYEKLRNLERNKETPAIQYADFAATAQQVFTETIQEFLNNIYDLEISDNLVLSGGCALNSSANGTIIEHTPFTGLYVGSAPADDGNALGAAYLAYYEDNGFQNHRRGVISPYLGSEMTGASFERLKKFCAYKQLELDDEELFTYTATALSEGKIIGWVQGKAEFGPRALGNRSILADPRFPGVKNRINTEIKYREEFRPFAPSILHECGDEYFENYQFSPYMERTLKFKEAAMERVAGVVHEDGTGRLQSVTEELNPRYYKLISTFYKISGVPLLLNTSFNVMGKPIIHSVEDAVAVFQTSGLDILIIENTVFLKDPSSKKKGIE